MSDFWGTGQLSRSWDRSIARSSDRFQIARPQLPCTCSSSILPARLLEYDVGFLRDRSSTRSWDRSIGWSWDRSIPRSSIRIQIARSQISCTCSSSPLPARFVWVECRIFAGPVNCPIMGPVNCPVIEPVPNCPVTDFRVHLFIFVLFWPFPFASIISDFLRDRSIARSWEPINCQVIGPVSDCPVTNFYPLIYLSSLLVSSFEYNVGFLKDGPITRSWDRSIARSSERFQIARLQLSCTCVIFSSSLALSFEYNVRFSWDRSSTRSWDRSIAWSWDRSIARSSNRFQDCPVTTFVYLCNLRPLPARFVQSIMSDFCGTGRLPDHGTGQLPGHRSGSRLPGHRLSCTLCHLRPPPAHFVWEKCRTFWENGQLPGHGTGQLFGHRTGSRIARSQHPSHLFIFVLFQLVSFRV